MYVRMWAGDYKETYDTNITVHILIGEYAALLICFGKHTSYVQMLYVICRMNTQLT